MQDRPPNRRHILKAIAGLGVMAPLPLWAAPMPSVEDVAFDPDIPVLGNPKGDVTVVEFTDYQCPYCKLSFIELSKVMAEDGNIRVLLRDWPIFGEVSRNAALLTLASNSQGRYADAVRTLMTTRERLTFSSTADLLSDIGVSVPQARSEIDTRRDTFVNLLARSHAQATAFQLRGTPGFLIGKSLYKRGMSADDFREAIALARS
ncbi:DsbA family protein [Aminobacter sp. AP02]|uniref:DsbA family protein n=1 Tax=Aminobacter sp. AP02 TaxID=2135737 RepID=UPI000D6D4352|nr:DsbA family protein [Aminobacter sp. AP02]PWK75520.1 protein-disulfide isomerase [Aminobacter sp. AP02]